MSASLMIATKTKTFRCVLAIWVLYVKNTKIVWENGDIKSDLSNEYTKLFSVQLYRNLKPSMINIAKGSERDILFIVWEFQANQFIYKMSAYKQNLFTSKKKNSINHNIYSTSESLARYSLYIPPPLNIFHHNNLASLTGSKKTTNIQKKKHISAFIYIICLVFFSILFLVSR